MTWSVDPIVRMNSQLCQLVARGFQFVHPTGAAGEILAIVGVRAHGTVTDVICLRGEGDARAVRMPADESDILAPTTTLWEQRGPAATVLTELLRLPDVVQVTGVGGRASAGIL